MAESEARPPYVRFEIRSEEDRQATIEAGHYVGRDVTYAIVTPTGSRDQVEREANAWLDNIREGVKQERIPSFWVDAYERALKAYEESRETPEDGTPILDWPGASPSQIKTMLDINVRTVEDLAAANEETVQRIGMGGRALKQKAIIWIEEASGQGKTTEMVNALTVENERLKADNEALGARLTALEKAVKLKKA